MNFWRYLRIMFVTRKCVICDEPISYEERVPICDYCIEKWDKQLNVKCVSCGNKKESCFCIPQELKKIVPFACWSIFYTGNMALYTPDRMVKTLKEIRSRDIIEFCAEMMKKSIVSQCKIHGVDYKEFAITYTPRSKRNYYAYGLDQSKELAKSISAKLGIELVHALENIGKKQQKRLDKDKRRENAKNSYVLREDFECKHKKYFLVDDVLTSGATMYFCAMHLYDSGAETVIPVTYCKDNIESKKKKDKKKKRR